MTDEQATSGTPPAPPAGAPSGPPSGGPSGPPSGHRSGPPDRRPREGHSGPGGGPRRGKRQFFRKKKVCRFCVERIDFIDYKKADLLQSFVQDRGKIVPRRITGTCSKHQRWLGVAIKRARNIALLPFGTEL